MSLIIYTSGKDIQPATLNANVRLLTLLDR